MPEAKTPAEIIRSAAEESRGRQELVHRAQTLLYRASELSMRLRDTVGRLLGSDESASKAG